MGYNESDDEEEDPLPATQYPWLNDPSQGGQPLPAEQYPWLNDPGYQANGLPNPSYMPSSSGSSGSGMPSSSGSSGGSGMSMPSMGNMVGPGISGLGELLSSYFDAKNKNKQAALDRQARADLESNNLASNTAAGTQALASRESQLDPFRSRMMQTGDIAKLDRVQNATMSPRRLTPAPAYAGSVPQISGGYSYQKSPDVINAAGAAKTSIMAGNQDPSMTNPLNYGKSGALDLLGIAAGQKNAASPTSFATGAPNAGSSLGADPVANIVRQGYQSVLGRSPSDAEIQMAIGNLSKIYGRQMTTADSRLITDWIQKNLATSPEAMRRNGLPGPSYATPSSGPPQSGGNPAGISPDVSNHE